MSDNVLGKGLDALIQKPEKSPKKPEKETQFKTENNNRYVLSDEEIQEIKDKIEKNPRISLWSVKSAACLRYLKKTTPEFSISNEASLILEEAIAEKYPEIWDIFEDL